MGASEVFKNQSFENPLFALFANCNHGLIIMILLFFINKIKNLLQFLEKNLNKRALNHIV